MVIVDVGTTIITSVSSSKKQQLIVDDRAEIKFATISRSAATLSKLYEIIDSSSNNNNRNNIDNRYSDRWVKEKKKKIDDDCSSSSKSSNNNSGNIIITLLSHYTILPLLLSLFAPLLLSQSVTTTIYIITFHLQPLFPFNTAIRTIVAADIYYYHSDCYIFVIQLLALSLFFNQR